MLLVTAGKMNKQAAGDLGLSEMTVKTHRGAAMRKMGAPTLADLVLMAEALQLGNSHVDGRIRASPAGPHRNHQLRISP
jgi:hypothetical protein